MQILSNTELDDEERRTLEQNVPILQRWLLIRSCNELLHQIGEQTKEIETHLHGSDFRVGEKEITLTEPVVGDPLINMVVPKWTDTVLGNDYNLTWEHDTAGKYRLVGHGADHGHLVVDTYTTESSVFMRRLLHPDPQELPTDAVLVMGFPTTEIIDNVPEKAGERIDVDISGNSVTAVFGRHSGWGDFLDNISGEKKFDVAQMKLKVGPNHEEALTISIPKMKELTSDELEIKQGETVTIEPYSIDRSGFYDAKVTFEGRKLSIATRVRGERVIDSGAEIPVIDTDKINEQIVAALLRAQTMLKNRLNAMDGIYVKPVNVKDKPQEVVK